MVARSAGGQPRSRWWQREGPWGARWQCGIPSPARRRGGTATQPTRWAATAGHAVVQTRPSGTMCNKSTLARRCSWWRQRRRVGTPVREQSPPTRFQRREASSCAPLLQELFMRSSSPRTPMATGSLADPYALRCISDLAPSFRPVFRFRYFNSLQSECFNVCFSLDVNMVISVPTGSGKTELFELCILRLLSRFLSPDWRFNLIKGTLKTD